MIDGRDPLEASADRASRDRALAALLDVAEDASATDEARVEAAQTVAGLTYPLDDGDDVVQAAFRAGALWRKRNPRARYPDTGQMIELALDAAR